MVWRLPPCGGGAWKPGSGSSGTAPVGRHLDRREKKSPFLVGGESGGSGCSHAASGRRKDVAGRTNLPFRTRRCVFRPYLTLVCSQLIRHPLRKGGGRKEERREGSSSGPVAMLGSKEANTAPADRSPPGIRCYQCY